MLPFSEGVVPLAEILPDDQSYRITTENDKDDRLLQQSIVEVGLLSPPVLQALRPNTWRVVTGFRRLAALQRLNFSQTPCRLLDQTTDALACLKISITDNAWQRPLNPGEQARAVYKLSLLIDQPGDLRRTAAVLGLPSTATAVSNLLIVHSLPSVIFDYVSAGVLAFSTALSLAAIDGQAAIKMARLFADLKLGGNRQRTAMTLIEEISAVEEISRGNLLDEIRLQDIINDPEADRGLRSEAFFRCLRLRRFPYISRVEDEFAGTVRALKPGPRAKLTPSTNFEGVDYTLQLTFKNGKEIDEHLALLQRIAASELIEKKK